MEEGFFRLGGKDMRIVMNGRENEGEELRKSFFQREGADFGREVERGHFHSFNWKISGREMRNGEAEDDSVY